MMDSAALAGSFYASGIRQVKLGSEACFIGHGAFESCKIAHLGGHIGHGNSHPSHALSHNATAWKRSNCHPACVISKKKHSQIRKVCEILVAQLAVEFPRQQR